MTSRDELQAALAWADWVEQGNAATYDPYVVALAHAVREQHELIDKMRKVIGRSESESR